MMAMTDDQIVDFCKVDSNLDSNPKIRKAGFFGATVFQFILRVNRRMRSDGLLPIAYVESDYIAAELRIPGDDAIDIAHRAVAACINARLLELVTIDGEDYARIVGWEEEWGLRAPKSGRERTKAWREKQQQRQRATGDGRDERDGGDAIRGEERRGEDQTLAPDSDIPPELPEQGATVRADRGPAMAFADALKAAEPKFVEQFEQANRPPPGIPMPGSRDRRIKLNHDTWAYAQLEHSRLRADGIDPNAADWPVMPGGAAMHELVARVGEVLGQDVEPNYEKAKVLIKRRIDVAVAEAKREGHLRWFTPTRIFDSKSFWRAAELTPEQVSRAGPRGAPPKGPTEPPRRRLRNLG